MPLSRSSTTPLSSRCRSRTSLVCCVQLLLTRVVAVLLVSQPDQKKLLEGQRKLGKPSLILAWLSAPAIYTLLSPPSYLSCLQWSCTPSSARPRLAPTA